MIFSTTGVTVFIATTTFSFKEGDAGDMTPIGVCIILIDVQIGLLREVRLSLTVDSGSASMSQFCLWHVLVYKYTWVVKLITHSGGII